jgi:hypothetical protein
VGDVSCLFPQAGELGDNVFTIAAVSSESGIKMQETLAEREIFVGRSRKCHLMLRDDTVSGLHCRLVASESVATRDPFEVLRTSGSAPRLPISWTLLRLRLTCTSRVSGPLCGPKQNLAS